MRRTRLSERDLSRIVRRVIRESNELEKLKQSLTNVINDEIGYKI